MSASTFRHSKSVKRALNQIGKWLAYYNTESLFGCLEIGLHGAPVVALPPLSDVLDGGPGNAGVGETELCLAARCARQIESSDGPGALGPTLGPPRLNDQFILHGFQGHAGQVSAITTKCTAGFAADFRRSAGEGFVLPRIHQHFKDNARPGVKRHCLFDILSHLSVPVCVCLHRVI